MYGPDAFCKLYLMMGKWSACMYPACLEGSLRMPRSLDEIRASRPQQIGGSIAQPARKAGSRDAALTGFVITVVVLRNLRWVWSVDFSFQDGLVSLRRCSGGVWPLVGAVAAEKRLDHTRVLVRHRYRRAV